MKKVKGEVENIMSGEKINEKIREVRKGKGITLKELSESTQLSVSFLSQVERGISSMTITSLKCIANALEIPLRDLVTVNDDETFLRKKDNTLLMNLEKSYINYSRLSGKFVGRELEAMLLTMKPNFQDEELMAHEGEEFYYVLSGKGTFIIDGKEYEVNAGETIHYPSNKLHKTVNNENVELVMLSVSIPIIF